jgi:ABC-type multidrug transport system ATPase subunit
VSREFGSHQALLQVTLSIPPKRIHALLGPNAAGKTTFLRILAGLTEPTSGQIAVLGEVPYLPEIRRRIGWVPSGDRSFYLRISGLENLIFFGRLQGLGARQAKVRAIEMLEAVGLDEAAGRRAGLYSHGMLKRLAVARALLAEPEVLLFDEATHDLDPQGAREIRNLVDECVAGGATVVWATQRLDELLGFADSVTVLDRGSVVFQDSLEELVAMASSRRFRMRLRAPLGELGVETVRAALDGIGDVRNTIDQGHFLIDLRRDITLGQGIGCLTNAGIEVVTCSEERSEVESAFLALTGVPEEAIT